MIHDANMHTGLYLSSAPLSSMLILHSKGSKRGTLLERERQVDPILANRGGPVHSYDGVPDAIEPPLTSDTNIALSKAQIYTPLGVGSCSFGPLVSISTDPERITSALPPRSPVQDSATRTLPKCDVQTATRTGARASLPFETTSFLHSALHQLRRANDRPYTIRQAVTSWYLVLRHARQREITRPRCTSPVETNNTSFSHSQWAGRMLL